MSKLRGVGVGLVFLAGCAVGGAANRLAVPTASAQQAATLTRWEYSTVEFDSNHETTLRKANEAGLQGWEAFAHGDSGRWYMRRPKL
jgi:hypothetical protein